MANTFLPAGASGTTLALPGTADVSDELGRAGMSFGKLVETTGKAIADTQLKLNQTGAGMASVSRRSLICLRMALSALLAFSNAPIICTSAGFAWNTRRASSVRPLSLNILSSAATVSTSSATA